MSTRNYNTIKPDLLFSVTLLSYEPRRYLNA